MNHAILPVTLVFFLLCFFILKGAERFEKKNSLWMNSQSEGAGAYKLTFWWLFLFFFAEVAFYLYSHSITLFDAEAGSLAVSFLWANGWSLYHSPNSDALYSLLYGPLFFIIYGIPAFFVNASLLPQKLLALAMLSATCTMLWRLAKSSTVNNKQFWALMLFGLMCVMLFGRASFSARGDIVILMVAVIATLAARTKYAFLVLAVCAGIAVNVKITSIIFVLPVLAIIAGHLIEDTIQWRRISEQVALGLAIFVVIAAAPFFSPGVDFKNYMWWLGQSSKHQFEIERMVKSSYSIFVFCSLPALYLGFTRGWGERSTKAIGWALAVSAFVLATLGGKVGAGPYHMLMLLPAYMVYLGGLMNVHGGGMVNPSRTSAAVVMSTFLAMNAFVIFLFLLNTSHLRTSVFGSGLPVPEAAAEEVTDLVHKYGPSIAMGLGSLSSRSVNLNTNVIMQGGQFLMTDVSLWDAHASRNQIANELVAKVNSCSISNLLIPHNDEPFKSESLYYKGVMIADSVREAFKLKYSKEAEYAYFDVWKCRG